MQEQLLKKISHNKALLFIVPNFIYIFKLLNFYNNNLDNTGEMFFYEVILITIIFFTITTIVHFLLISSLKDRQKVFCITCFITPFYFIKFTLINFLLYLVFTLILILDFKKIIRFKLDNIITIIVFIIAALFIYNFVVTTNTCLKNLLKTKSYNYDININVDDTKKETPNIYYIHCDGMMGISAMKKYFNYTDTLFTDYLTQNNFYLNTTATIKAGHKTTRSLVALFNPTYYDNFYKEYLDDLENSYIKGTSTKFEITYNELTEKRLHNELFTSLKAKGYKTVAIAEYNQYTSLDVDAYYDYYIPDNEMRHLNKKYTTLRYINSNNSSLRKNMYIRFVHFNSVLNKTIFYNLLDNINFLDNDIIDYNNLNTTNYNYIDTTTYWPVKAMLKAVELENANTTPKFVFIDYNLNHLPLTYDEYGNQLNFETDNDLNHYLGNYKYSTYLLMDMVSFIKNNDENAVIILEGDHGIHMLKDENLMQYFDTDIDGVYEIRNSVISAIYIPEKYQNGDEKYLNNPLNISRYLVNNYVSNTYTYIE